MPTQPHLSEKHADGRNASTHKYYDALPRLDCIRYKQQGSRRNNQNAPKNKNNSVGMPLSRLALGSCNSQCLQRAGTDVADISCRAVFLFCNFGNILVAYYIAKDHFSLQVRQIMQSGGNIF